MGTRSRLLETLVVAAGLACAMTGSAHAEPTAGSASAPAPAPTRTSPPPPAPPAPKPQQPAAKPPAQSTQRTTQHGHKTPTSSAKPAKQETGVRRSISGGPTLDDTAVGADTPELRALLAAERELFPPAAPAIGSPWPQELPFPVAASDDKPRVHASGLPPSPPTSTPQAEPGAKDIAWLAKLDMPDLPVRWDPRVVRYLELFKDDARLRGIYTRWLTRSGRYRDAIKKVLRKKGLPEDLVALVMIESGFDPTARSPVGALGLWQFMPETGKIYGLTQDRWADTRMSLAVSTEAATDFLADLYRRFGSWDLAMAAYNMGYGGVVAAVRRYNTNDYWALSKLEGSLPWETTLYVPKILAAAVVMRNLAAFGYQDVAIDAPLDGEDVPVAPGTSLATVAQACGTTTKDLEALNPELRASRTPPQQDDWNVHVPTGKASGCAQALAKKHDGPALEKYVVRFGESLEQIAQARRVPASKIIELNGISPGEVVRGGTVLLLPKGDAQAAPAPEKKADKPVVVVPQELFVYPDRRRVFYHVQIGDTVRDVCAAFHVSTDELRRWNEIDPSARLVENMTLQLFVRNDADLSHVVALGESDVHVVVVGSDEFFQRSDEKGRRRIVVTAKSGDTLESIGKKHGVSTAMMERINRRGRSEPLAEGDSVVVWVPAPQATGPAAQASLTHSSSEPTQTAPLATPPAPDQLPALP